MRIRRHHEQAEHDERDERDERERPVWQASKPAWGVVSIDAPKAVELRSPDRAA